MATKPGLASRSRASRRSARVAPDGGDPAVSELDLMERSLRIERAARVRAEQAARHAKAAIATAETLREATVKAAAVQLEAGMARQERLLKKQAELKRELQVVSQICNDSEALAGESSYARQIGRLKARLHVTSAFRPPTLLALGRAAEPRGGQRERLRCGHEGRPRSPMMQPNRRTPPRRSCAARPRLRRRWSPRPEASQSRRDALHCTPWHPRATRVTAGTARCTVPRVPLGSPKAKPRPQPRALARTRARVRRRWWRCRCA